MRERPILFSGPMVRALLAGTKTQTRRVVKHVPALGWVEDWCHRIHDADFQRIVGDYRRFCPYGQPGDRLWVRETWRTDWVVDILPPSQIGPSAGVRYEADGFETIHGSYSWSKHVRPSIFMPRWASRITLEVTAIRVERLQDISEEGAKAEGICSDANGQFRPSPVGHRFLQQIHLTARGAYCTLWESINGPGSWGANPWVWVVEFRRKK